MKYQIQNQNINLDLNDNVFTPSPHGSSALGSSIKITPGETVLDVGTGTGLLAILAAKLGGLVTAIDVVSDAITTTKKNAEKNNVSINVLSGDLFEPVKGKIYDVIIANVPQENLSPNIINSMPPKKVIGMDGGRNGNEILLKVLHSASLFMHQNSRLYVVVYSMSDFRKTIKKINEMYNTKLLDFYTGPVKEFVYKDIQYYETQTKSGGIDIYKRGDEYWADLFVFELSIK